jgi:lysophospholipase L1-like esterase
LALSRRKKLLFALVAVGLSLAMALVVLLAADLVLHQRAERSAGLNRWGYRGPVVGRKQPGETRIVMLGGSTMFGYGVTWDEAIPALVEKKIRSRHPDRPVSAVNLAFNNEGAYAYLPTLRDFAYLDYDVVVLYEGYNDMIGDASPNLRVFRDESAVFRLTGYFPILPMYLNEKAMMIRTGGDLAAAYENARGETTTVFRPNLAQRTSAAALEGASAVGNALSRQIGRLAKEEAGRPVTTSELGCHSPWANYCASVHRAIAFATASGKGVLVVGQPALTGEYASRHVEQQAEVRDMITRHFGAIPNVRYLNLADVVNVDNLKFAFDKMHLNAAGNDVVAERLVEPVLALSPK